jgi:hypothetical protein
VWSEATPDERAPRCRGRFRFSSRGQNLSFARYGHPGNDQKQKARDYSRAFAFASPEDVNLEIHSAATIEVGCCRLRSLKGIVAAV